jgi:hypothetical protein
MTKRFLGSLCVAGAILVGGMSYAPTNQVHAAGKTRTIHKEGFSVAFPSTWQYVATIKLADVFTSPTLRKLPADATGLRTADGKAGMVILVVRGAATQATIKSEDIAMFNDAGKQTKPISYSTVKQNGSTFALAAATLKSGSDTADILIAAVVHRGKTYYFIAVDPTDSSAQGKTDHSELVTALDSIAVG